MMMPSTVPPTSPGIQIALNYPFMLILLVIIIIVLYKIMKDRRSEPAMDDDWLEEGNT